MTKVEKIEAEVRSLTQEELNAFRQWFIRFESNAQRQSSERTQWSDAAAEGLERAYGENEPEYSDADLKP